MVRQKWDGACVFEEYRLTFWSFMRPISYRVYCSHYNGWFYDEDWCPCKAKSLNQKTDYFGTKCSNHLLFVASFIDLRTVTFFIFFAKCFIKLLNLFVDNRKQIIFSCRSIESGAEICVSSARPDWIIASVTQRSVKPVLNWANACSPNILRRDSSTNYDSFSLNRTFSSPNFTSFSTGL